MSDSAPTPATSAWPVVEARPWSEAPHVWTGHSSGKPPNPRQVSWSHPCWFFVLLDVGTYVTIQADLGVLEVIMKGLADEERLTKLKLEDTRIYTRGMDLEQLGKRVRQVLDSAKAARLQKEEARES